MRGEILSYDGVTGAGLISGDDGLRYEFGAADIQSGTAAPALRVDFVPIDGLATQIMVLAAAPQAAVASTSGGPASGGPATGIGSADAIDWRHLMFRFNGRTRRTHFGIAWLILFGASFILGLIPFIGTLISLALIWPNLAITVKRLHDMGRSGWFAVIPYVTGLVGLIAGIMLVGASAFANAEALQNEDPAAIFAVMGPAFGVFGLVALVGLGFLLWIGLTPGQRGTNRFGPNPKGE